MKFLTILLLVLVSCTVSPRASPAPPPTTPEIATGTLSTLRVNKVVVRILSRAPTLLRPLVETLQAVGAQIVYTFEDPPENFLERAILDRAMQCDRARIGKFDRALLRDLLRFEKDFNVPPQMRGMVLVAACHESGFDPNNEGDHNFSPKGQPVAIGILQQWPWWTTSPWGPKIDRRDPRAAAYAWLAHVAKQVPTVQRLCRLREPSQVDDIWRVAWVTGVRAPSKTPRCKQAPTHWGRFKKWRPHWEHLVDGSRVLAQDEMAGEKSQMP